MCGALVRYVQYLESLPVYAVVERENEVVEETGHQIGIEAGLESHQILLVLRVPGAAVEPPNGEAAHPRPLEPAPEKFQVLLVGSVKFGEEGLRDQGLICVWFMSGLLVNAVPQVGVHSQHCFPILLYLSSFLRSLLNRFHWARSSGLELWTRSHQLVWQDPWPGCVTSCAASLCRPSARYMISAC